MLVQLIAHTNDPEKTIAAAAKLCYSDAHIETLLDGLTPEKTEAFLQRLDALQLVEALQPDFLLTDIRMPFISGTALTRQAKAVQPLLQVAFLSGYDDFEYAKAGIEDEIVAYLLKPISMAELTEELRKIHDKIEKRLASLTRPQGGAEALRKEYTGALMQARRVMDALQLPGAQ